MRYEQSARARIMGVLRGESENHVPFTTYSLFSELNTFERRMRERGLGYVAISSSYDIVQKEATVREIRLHRERRLRDDPHRIRNALRPSLHGAEAAAGALHALDEGTSV